MPTVKRVGAGGINKIKQLDDRVEKIEKRLEAEDHLNITDPPKYESRACIKLADGRRIQVRRVEKWGAFVVNIPYKFEPGIQDCEFMTWVEIEKQRG